MKADEKTCPQCAGTVKSGTLTCKHCGYYLSPAMEISTRSLKKHDLCCLRCGSDTTQHLAHYVKTGTVSNDGFVLVTSARSPLRGPLVATTHSTSINEIAKANPPPSHFKLPPLFLVLGFIFALPALALSPIVSAVFVGLGVWAMMKAEKYNREVSILGS